MACAVLLPKIIGKTHETPNPIAFQSPKSSKDVGSYEQSPKSDEQPESSDKKASEKTDKKSASPDKKTTKGASKNTSPSIKSPKKETSQAATPPANPPRSEPAPTPAPTPAPNGWLPTVGQTWQYQLMDTVDLSIKANVYDIDGFDTPASKVKAIHDQGSYAICYISAGSWENWRPDAGQFPASVKGKNLDGWPGEKWLDTRNINALASLMSHRMDMCASKGFDGVEFDNIDGHIQDSGFGISYTQQLTYNKWLADTARAKGLKVGLKNNLDQVSRLVGHYDFAVNEECYEWNECAELTPFINAHKPVFHVEYNHSPSQFCPTTTKLRFSSIKKSLDLKAPLVRC